MSIIYKPRSNQITGILGAVRHEESIICHTTMAQVDWHKHVWNQSIQPDKYIYENWHSHPIATRHISKYTKYF